MIIKGKVLADRLRDTTVTVENGVITAIGAPFQGEDTLDMSDNYVLPGFLDIHTHGALGYDAMDGNDEAMGALKRYMADRGVTGFLATTLTAPLPDIHRVLAAAKRNAFGAGASILGVHLEGPYFGPVYKGAQNPAYLREPSVREAEELLAAGEGILRIISLAPELPGAEQFIRYITTHGVVASLGHTNADYETVQSAIEWGATNITHMFNAMTPLSHRAPGVVGAALESKSLWTELICDDVHVLPAVIRVAIAARGYEKIVLISDSIRAAGMPDGEYNMGGQPMYVKNGHATLAGDVVAGSTSNILACFRNLVRWGIVTVEQAARMASTQPALASHCFTKGQIAAGFDGDFTILDKDLNLVATVIGGKVWQK